MSDQHDLCVRTIKGLAMDGVQKANSGHPGMPMGTADIATVVWRKFLKHDPADPHWPDRDRFVLSAGHGSMLLYSLLHLSGYDLSLDDIKDFRQWGSKTPGHPEVHEAPGVETTTGPLGQGFANGIGMALAEKFLRDTFGSELCDHYTYAIVSDGDLMEGISHEAGSLAGHLGLGRVVYLYDDNSITIDGGTDISYTEDVPARFAAYGWHVQTCDGHDEAAIEAAIHAARAVTDKPSIICCKTIIGKDSDIEGTSKTHGSPLGDEIIANTKKRIGLDPEQFFAITDEAYAAFREHDGASAHAAWKARLAEHPRGAELQQWLAGDTAALSSQVEWPSFETGKGLATRKASLACLKAIVAKAPWVIGGSADLAGSNGTKIGLPFFQGGGASFDGAATINFGVREHGMGGICNGIALHGGALPYCATFLMFHDYQRPSVRLSALMNQQVLYIYTHDSIFLGEDGPTHQPIATLMALRAIPNSRVVRPGDANETIAAWQMALEHTTGPTSLILTRQGLPVLAEASVEGAKRGGYILSDVDDPQVVLVATGSEVATALDGQKLLAEEGIRARVVSLPCRELFWEQGPDYCHSVLGEGLPRVSIEAGVTAGWRDFVGDNAKCIGIDRFGASAPAKVLAEKFGFTGENVAATAKSLL